MDVDSDRYASWLQAKVDETGIPLEVFLKTSISAIIKFLEAGDRWARLEARPARSAPIWIGPKDAEQLLVALRGNRSPEMRLLRPEIREVRDGR